MRTHQICYMMVSKDGSPVLHTAGATRHAARWLAENLGFNAKLRRELGCKIRRVCVEVMF